MYRCYKTNQVAGFRTNHGHRFLCQLKHRRHHHMSIGMAIFKMSNKSGRGLEKGETSDTDGENANEHSPCGKLCTVLRGRKREYMTQ